MVARWTKDATTTEGEIHTGMYEAFDRKINQRVAALKSKTGKPVTNAKKMHQNSPHRDRQETRLTTRNVYSKANKLKTVERYLKTNRVHIAAITETHIQEGDKIDIRIKGYTIVSKCRRKKGELKGGIAIYVHDSIPHCNGEDKTVWTQHELEHCPAIVYPNHNERDELAIVGVYRPPVD